MYWVWFSPISLQSRQCRPTRAPIRGLFDTLRFLITIREDFISEYLTLKSFFPFSHLDLQLQIDVRFDWNIFVDCPNFIDIPSGTFYTCGLLLNFKNFFSDLQKPFLQTTRPGSWRSGAASGGVCRRFTSFLWWLKIMVTHPRAARAPWPSVCVAANPTVPC